MESSSSDVTDEEAGFCGQPVPDRDRGTGSAVAQFSKDEVTRLVETVVSYASVEEGTAAFARLQQIVQTCKRGRRTGPDGLPDSS
jgi:hypothetical protein